MSDTSEHIEFLSDCLEAERRNVATLSAEVRRLRAAEAAARADERARFAPLLEACQTQLKDSAGSFYERVQRALRELERCDHIAGKGET
jgi:hypothetical protein